MDAKATPVFLTIEETAQYMKAYKDLTAKDGYGCTIEQTYIVHEGENSDKDGYGLYCDKTDNVVPFMKAYGTIMLMAELHDGKELTEELVKTVNDRLAKYYNGLKNCMTAPKYNKDGDKVVRPAKFPCKMAVQYVCGVNKDGVSYKEYSIRGSDAVLKRIAEVRKSMNLVQTVSDKVKLIAN